MNTLINRLKKYSKYIFYFCVSFLMTSPVLAGSLVPNDGKKKTGDYTLNDFILVAINVSQWVLILSGSLALLAFVYGGFMFILSSGNKNMVEKGKESIIGGVIGLAIVLLAFTAINYFMESLGYQKGDFGIWNSSAVKTQ